MSYRDTTRRNFLRTSSVAAGALTFATSSLLKSITASSENPAFKICIFSKHLQFLDYEEMAETAAEIGFDGIDLAVRPGGHVLPERVEDDLPRAVESVRKAGLEVFMITTGISDPKERFTEVILRTAQENGIGFYRMGYLSYDIDKGIASSLAELKPKIRDLAALNQLYNVHGAYQNHAGTRVGGPVWDIWELIKKVNPQWLGCQYDIRHAVVEGGQAWPLGLRLLQDYVKTIVCKDFYWAKNQSAWKIVDCPIGEGMVPWRAYFDMIRSLGIKAPISIHTEYEPYDPRSRAGDITGRRKQAMAFMRKDLDKTRMLLREAGLRA